MNKEVTETIFNKIDTEAKSYWLGFLFADGTVKQNSIQLHLGMKDKSHLERFKEFLNTPYMIKEYNTLNKKTMKHHKSVMLTVTSPYIVNDLKQWNFLTPKEKRFPLPKIPNELFNHFLRGIFDGDGCITHNEKNYEVFFIATTPVITQLKPIIDNISQWHGFVIPLSNVTKTSRLRYKERKPIELIGKYLYQNATIYLERKHHRFEELEQLNQDEPPITKYSYIDTEVFEKIKQMVEKNEQIDWEAMSKQSHRSIQGLQKKCHRLGIRFRHELTPIPEITERKGWSEDEITQLRDRIKNGKSNREIAIEFHRTLRSIQDKRRKIEI